MGKRGSGRLPLAAGIFCAASLVACSASQSGAPEQDASDDVPYDRVIYYDGGGVNSFGDDSQAQPVPLSSLTSYSMDFAQVGCGSAPASQTLTILNNGAAPLTVAATTTGTVFSVGPAMLNIPVDGTGAMQVAATVPGSAPAGMRITGSLLLATNDPAMSNIAVPLFVTPAGATLALSPAVNTVAFPASDVGEATYQYVTVENNGNASATFVVAPPSNGAFALLTDTSDGGVTLGGGDTWTGKVSFTAADTTQATATCALQVTGATCAGSLATLALAGQGAYGQITGWPTAPVDFGLAPCGGAPPPPQIIQLKNTGGVDVRITGASIIPANSGFAVDKDLVGRYIPAHQDYVLHVTAPAVPTPSPLTPIAATLNILTDADSTPHAITLQEEPQGAVLAFDTSATSNFGSFGQVVLLLSATQKFGVTNTGNAPADVVLGTNAPDGGAGDGGAADAALDANAGVDATLDGPPDAAADAGPPSVFAIADTSFSLPPNGQHTDAATFVPRTGASYVDAIHVSTDAKLCSPLPAPLPLSGVGFGGGVSILPTSVAFTAPCGGGSPGTQVVTLTNTGPADMTWALGALTGPGAAQYTISALSGLLRPGASAPIQVTAAAVPSPAPDPDPAAFGAQFTITTDIPNDSAHVVDLSETPIGDVLSVSTPSLRFGTYPIDFESPPQSFTITNAANAGSAAATLTLTLSGGGGSLYVEPEDGGAVCIVAGDASGEGGGLCAVPDAGDAALAGDAGDGGCSEGGDGGEGGCPPLPELVQSGYVFPPQVITNLAPGGGTSAPMIVTFVPTSAASYPATITIQTTDSMCSALPGPIPLSGAGGQGQVSLSAASLTFGTDPSDPKGLVNCGATGLTQTLTVSNPGTQPFHVTSLSLGLGSSSPYVLGGPGATLPATVPVGGSTAITVTPSPIPTTVANPNDPSPFTDVLTLGTDAAFDSPHAVSLVMQARGAVIAARPLDPTWDFGTITLGSIGTIASSIQNTGNAPASLALQGLSHPSIFGLLNDPTRVAANGSTAFVAQFTPDAANQTFGDQGTLVVTTPQAFCQPLPPAWVTPTITLSGASSSNPPVSESGSLAFPAYECGGAAPAGQSIDLANASNQPYGFTTSFRSGTYYTANPASGTVNASATTAILVVPAQIGSGAQGASVATGSAAYADDLVIRTFPLSAPDAATGPTAPSFTLPISWTVNGAVLSLTQGAGPRTDGNGQPFYPADTPGSFALSIANAGNEAATVTVGVQPGGVATLSPGSPLGVVPGATATAATLQSTSSAPACPTTASATATFSYSGPVCQPLQFSSVAIDACAGTFR